jgi:hypothetical protein
VKAYKIFELGEEYGRPVPKTLFHGLNRLYVQGCCPPEAKYSVRRSRVLPVGEWIRAERRWVTDGSRRTPYESGFHCYTNLDAVRAWFKNARSENRVVVMVEVYNNSRVKPGAVRHTLLAHSMKIHAEDWERRVPAEALSSREDNELFGH